MNDQDISRQIREYEIQLAAEPKNNKGYGELKQSRAAIIAAVIVLFIVHVLDIISIFLINNNQQTGVFPKESQIIGASLIDIFLSIHLLRGKRWARTWMLVRLTAGIILWGIILIAQKDYGGLFVNTGILIALIILLTGRSTRIRTTLGVTVSIVAFIGGVVTNLMVPSVSLPSEPEILTIPETFSKYENTGLFSISYPPDWSPNTSVISEAEKEMKSYLDDIGMGKQANEVRLVFFGGKNLDSQDFTFVTIACEPQKLWPIETLVENTNKWLKENLDQYVEHSRIKTTIDGKKAVIQTYDLKDQRYGLVGYKIGYVVGEKLFWTVSCACDAQYLNSNSDTFDQIIRSLRIVN
jgi:hypothetical protein